MKKLIVFLTAIFAFVFIGNANAQYNKWGQSQRGWVTVSDTNGIAKTIGLGYYYTADSSYYLGMGTYLTKVAGASVTNYWVQTTDTSSIDKSVGAQYYYKGKYYLGMGSSLVLDADTSNNWIQVTDTSSVNKRIGRQYYYDGKYYIGAGTYLKPLSDQASGTFTGGTVSGATNFNQGVFFKDTVGFANGLRTDWIKPYTISKDTIGFHANPVFYPTGNALNLDGTDDYAYHADSDSLDFAGVDWGLSVMIQTSSTLDTLISKRASGAGWFLSTDSNGKAYFFLSDGTNTTPVTSMNAINDGNWHYIVVLCDTSGSAYMFVDGLYSNSASIAAVGSIANTKKLEVGNFDGGTTYSDAQVNELRLYNFGKDGFYLAGTGANNLEIWVGSSTGDIIYSEKSSYSPSHPGGLVPAMYRNPGASLSELGYGSLENAERSEKVTDGELEEWNSSTDLTNWGESGVSSGIRDIIQEATTVHNGTYSVKMKATANDGTEFYIRQNNYSVQNDGYYELTAWTYYKTHTDGVLKLYVKDQSYVTLGQVDIESQEAGWTKHTFVFKANGMGRIYCNLSSGTDEEAYVDNIYIKRIGEVAHWRMNESGTPSTLVDETDNSLDLTTVGSPIMVNADYQNLALKRIWADTVMADSATIRRVYTNRLGLPFLPSSEIPSSGDTIPGVYSYGGEVFAHDASGNNPQLSSHNKEGDWVLNSWNSNTGIRTWVNLIDALKTLEKVSGEKFIYQDTVFEEVSPEKAIAGLDTVIVTEDSLINKWDAFMWKGLKKELKKNVWYDEENKLYYMRVKRVKPFMRLHKGVFKKGKKFYRLNGHKLLQAPEAVKPK